MKNIQLFLAISLCVLFSPYLHAQEGTYYSFDYMKVEPQNIQDYLKLEKAWKKIHLKKVEEGLIEGWGLARVMSPAGANEAYNFVTRIKFTNKAQLVKSQSMKYMPENWKTLLTPDEIKLVQRTSELRTWVKNEVWSVEERIIADNISESEYLVFNYFDMPKGVRRSTHFNVERNLWKPFHQANIDNGNLLGWLLFNRELPMGSDYDYDVATVDLYKNMEQFWEEFDEGLFTKIHPNKTMEEIWEETMAAGNRIKAELREIIDSTWKD